MYINFLVALKLCRKAPVPVARDGQQNPGVHEERPVYHPPCHVHHPLPLPNQVCKAADDYIATFVLFLTESNNDHHRNSRTCFLVRFRFKLSEMKFFAFEVYVLFSSKFAKHKCLQYNVDL